MGSSDSVHYFTNEYDPKQWTYIQPTTEPTPAYGLFRTLKHNQTGEMIDEYDFLWGTQTDYQFYIHSFNWRINQPNIVNSKYFQEITSQDMCSRSYMGKIYIQHPMARLSEIVDIPYPENLCVAMEALEGYQKLLKHSKFYFKVQEDQICFDFAGNTKVWVNSDLSKNYSESEDFKDSQGKNQNDMVEEIFQLVFQNTDLESQPELTLKEYFGKKWGEERGGIGFEAAKILVNNYAKYHNVIIPNCFETLLNVYEDDSSDKNRPNQFNEPPLPHHNNRNEYDNRTESDLTNHHNYQQNIPLTTRVHPSPPHILYSQPPTYQAEPQYHTQILPNQMHSHQPLNHYQRNAFIPYNNFPNNQSQPPNFVSQSSMPLDGQAYNNFQQQPFQIPYRERLEVRSGPPPLQFRPLQTIHQNNIMPVIRASEVRQPTTTTVIHNEQQQMSVVQEWQPPHDQVMMIPLKLNNTGSRVSNNINISETPSIFMNGQEVENRNESSRKETVNVKQSKQSNQENNFMQSSDCRFGDLQVESRNVIKSLPLQMGHPSSTGLQLNQQNDRTIYSHIREDEEKKVVNNDGFGLTVNSYNKLTHLKESSLSYNKNQRSEVKDASLQGRGAETTIINKQSKQRVSKNKDNEREKILYYSNLDQLMELDQDIANDMRRFCPA